MQRLRQLQFSVCVHDFVFLISSTGIWMASDACIAVGCQRTPRSSKPTFLTMRGSCSRHLTLVRRMHAFLGVSIGLILTHLRIVARVLRIHVRDVGALEENRHQNISEERQHCSHTGQRAQPLAKVLDGSWTHPIRRGFEMTIFL